VRVSSDVTKLWYFSAYVSGIPPLSIMVTRSFLLTAEMVVHRRYSSRADISNCFSLPPLWDRKSKTMSDWLGRAQGELETLTIRRRQVRIGNATRKISESSSYESPKIPTNNNFVPLSV